MHILYNYLDIFNWFFFHIEKYQDDFNYSGQVDHLIQF